MKRVYVWLLWACACHSVQLEQSPSFANGSSRGVGLNLSSVSYYSTQTPFSDLFRNRDRWLSTDGSSWDTELADSIPVDPDGYPLEIPYKGQMLRASAFLPVHADDFELRWQGEGEVTVSGTQVEVTAKAERSVKFTAGPSLTEPVFVRIDRSSAKDHVRDIEIRGERGYENVFKSALRGFGVLRFMDWGATNDNPVQRWSERTTPQQAQGTQRGVAIETMIDTANGAHADLWLNLPHKADDDFMQRAAQLVAARLNPALKAYVEYSNENWNGMFSQVRWEREQGEKLGLHRVGAYALGEDSDEDSAGYWAGLKFSVRRAAVAHGAFRKALGAERVVAVVAGQSANPHVNEQLLSFYADRRINPLAGKPDALAVAPYFGTNYDDEAEGTPSVERILTDADESIAERVGEHTRENRKIADEHGVRLIAYEAGQHVLAVGGRQDDKQLVERIIAANRSPRMGELYRKAHRVWLESGGELAVYYSSCQAPSRYGSWGALEYQEQPQAEAPKWAALQTLARQ